MAAPLIPNQINANITWQGTAAICQQKGRAKIIPTNMNTENNKPIMTNPRCWQNSDYNLVNGISTKDRPANVLESKHSDEQITIYGKRYRKKFILLLMVTNLNNSYRVEKYI